MVSVVTGTDPLGWDDVPPLATDPSASPNVGGTDGGYLELPESGWGALVGWSAGIARLARYPDRADLHTTTTTTVGPGGEEHESRPRSADEQAQVDTDIDDYLGDAGIPARPRGYRWFLRPPPGWGADRFWDALNSPLNRDHPPATRPRELAARLRDILAEVYARQG
jgi:hypothetical protein